jgi:flap endonuclease-1
MGLNLKPLVTSNPIRISELVGKVVAVDAFNVIYQFLATIRGPTGELLANIQGDPTSHLSGLFYRNVNLLCDGVKLVYIFDGKPHELKTKEIERRKKAKEEASEKYSLALEEGRIDDAKKFSQGTSVLTSKMIEESKYLLSLMGIPYINAMSEGEATAALLSQKDLAYSSVSQDYDSILFGAKRLIRNLTISGKRKIPNRNVYIDIVPEIIEHDQVLKINNITHKQLVDIGILIGTDFNPNGFSGIGPKNALKLIQKYKKLEEIEKIKEELSNTPYNEIREIFLNPNVTDVEDLTIQFKDIEKEKIIKYLCDEKSFSIERVTNHIGRLEKNIIRKAESLDKWF